MRKEKAVLSLGAPFQSSRIDSLVPTEAAQRSADGHNSHRVTQSSAYFEMREQPIVTHDVIERLRLNIERLSDLQARMRFSMAEISSHLRRS